MSQVSALRDDYKRLLFMILAENSTPGTKIIILERATEL